MNRTSFGVGGLWAVSAGALLALACNGQIQTGSTNTPQLQTLSSADTAAIAGTTVTACATGYAHPNICCDGASCGDYPTAPFHACDTTATTYPDPRSCCDLTNGLNCAAPPPPPPTPTPNCWLTCAPGWVPPPPGTNVPVPVSGGGPTGSGSGSSYTGSGSGTDYGSGSGTAIGSGSGGGDPGSGVGTGPGGYVGSGSGTAIGSGTGSTGGGIGGICCQTDPNGTLTCAETASNASSGCTCACPAGGPCPPCSCPEEPVPTPTPVCNACPSGPGIGNWQPLPNGPADLCCLQDPSTGDLDCFSQGVPPVLGSGGSGSGSGSSSVGSTGTTDASVACPPLPCPLGQQEDAQTCSCVTCQPLPCPSNATWNPATCSCQ